MDGSKITDNCSCIVMEKYEMKNIHTTNGVETNNQPATKVKLENSGGLKILLTITQVVGGIFVILLTIWRILYGEGFGWRNPISTKLQYNWHPVLATIGMTYLFGNGLLMYRSFRSVKKPNLKKLHAVVLFAAFLLSFVGIFAVFDSRNFANPPKPHFNSLHSWFGIMAFVGFTLQWVQGLVTYMYPGLSAKIRVRSLPIHKYFGLVLFVMACICAMLGFPQKSFWSPTPRFGLHVNMETLLVNASALLLFLFAFLVVYLVMHVPFKRQSKTNE